MSDTTDENTNVSPGEDPGGMVPQDPPLAEESIGAASADEAPTGVLPSQEAPGASPPAEQTVAAQPTAAQPTSAEAPTPVSAAAAAPPQQSWIRRRWVPVVGVLAAGVVLLFSGAAFGSVFNGHDDFSDGGRGLKGGGEQVEGHDGQMRGRGQMDGQGQRGGYGQMNGRGALAAPPGAVSPDCDEEDRPQPDLQQSDPATTL